MLRVRKLQSKDRFQECFEGNLRSPRNKLCRHRGGRGVDGGGWLTPCPGNLYLRNDIGTHCTGYLVGPRVGLDGCGVQNNSCPHRKQNQEPFSRRRIAKPITQPGPGTEKYVWVFWSNRAWEFGTAVFEMWLQPRNVLKPSHILQLIHQSISRICN